MKHINKFLFFFFLFIGSLMRAEDIPDAPVPPPAPPGGGGGGVGPGVISSPIDMYIYGLVLLAFLFIVYFARKKQTTTA